MHDSEKIPMNVALTSSTISGILHILIGYPFDTIKTLQQSTTKINIQQLPYQRLFQGLKYPLIQNTFINSICFSLNNYFLNTIHNNNISHLCTAVTSTIILTPLDKYKIMSQFNIKHNISIKNIINSYKHFHIVCASEIPSTFLYFSVYQKLKTKQLPIFLCGALAGVSSCALTYPLDTIKTRLQNNSCKTIKQAFCKGSLYNGIVVCLLRSFLVNGVNFYCYEKISELIMNIDY